MVEAGRCSGRCRVAEAAPSAVLRRAGLSKGVNLSSFEYALPPPLVRPWAEADLPQDLWLLPVLTVILWSSTVRSKFYKRANLISLLFKLLRVLLSSICGRFRSFRLKSLSRSLLRLRRPEHSEFSQVGDVCNSLIVWRYCWCLSCWSWVIAFSSWYLIYKGASIDCRWFWSMASKLSWRPSGLFYCCSQFRIRSPAPFGSIYPLYSSWDSWGPY